MIKGVHQSARPETEDIRQGEGRFGWNRWSRKWLYQALELYGDYQVRYYQNPKVLPAR